MALPAGGAPLPPPELNLKFIRKGHGDGIDILIYNLYNDFFLQLPVGDDESVVVWDDCLLNLNGTNKKPTQSHEAWYDCSDSCVNARH